MRTTWTTTTTGRRGQASKTRTRTRASTAVRVLRETRFVGSVDEASKRLPWASTRQRLASSFVDPTLGEEVAVYCTQQLVALAEAPDGVVDLLDDMRSWLRPEKSEDDEEPMEREHSSRPTRCSAFL